MIPYLLHLFILLVIYYLLELGFVISFNYAGLINMAHIAFFALGAYVYAILTTMCHLGFASSALLAIMSVCLMGWLVSRITHRFHGDYLALVTLGFAVMLDVVLKNANALTNGPRGIPAIPPPVLFQTPIRSLEMYLLFFMCVGIVITLLVYSLKRFFGVQPLLALKEDELLLNTLGYNTEAIKSFILAFSAGLAAIAGVLYASYISFIDPYTFSMSMLMVIILMAALSGARPKLYRVWLSAALVIAIPELIRYFPLQQQYVGPLQQIIFAMILLALMWRQAHELKKHNPRTS